MAETLDDLVFGGLGPRERLARLQDKTEYRILYGQREVGIPYGSHDAERGAEHDNNLATTVGPGALRCRAHRHRLIVGMAQAPLEHPPEPVRQAQYNVLASDSGHGLPAHTERDDKRHASEKATAPEVLSPLPPFAR